MKKKNEMRSGMYVLLLAVFVLLGCSSERSAGSESREELLSPADVATENRIRLADFQETLTFYQRTMDRLPLVSAHRGGPAPGFPENAIETFQHTIEQVPAIIEFDVVMSADSVLMLMHDRTVDRTTTGSGAVAEMTFEQLRALRLVDPEGKATDFQIPTFEEALRWARGKALLTVDVKRGVPFSRIVAAIQEAEANPYAAVITYSAADAQEVHALDSTLMLSVTIRNEEELARMQATGIPVDRWIAFTGTRAQEPEHYAMLHALGVYTIAGTMGNLDRRAEARGDQIYQELVHAGGDIIATDRPVEAGKVLMELWQEGSSKARFIQLKSN
ncbi:glycerophosphodiester phosphodiesterase family protein [Nitritalea halalkaliphila]|nr:glycerophosphodiester phosphodiesterase family protein [Nitritalea halalkaliphila]